MEDRQLLDSVESALEIEEIDTNLFICTRNLWVPPGGRGVFGGQVIGQALVAATKTVEHPFLVHSLHTYFLRPGDPSRNIVYKVRRDRDGTSFKTRSVVALQSGKTIFMMICSFQIPEIGLEFQVKMPSAPSPDNLKSEEQKLREWIDRPDVNQKFKAYATTRLADPFPLEIVQTRTVKEYLKGDPMEEPRQQIWIRAKGNLGDRPAFHQCVAAYASDNLFLSTSLLAHGAKGRSKITHMATIDHSMWFHAPFRADEWLLFDMECTCTAGQRGLVFGRFFSRDGRLVVSCSQEGLIRAKLPEIADQAKL